MNDPMWFPWAVRVGALVLTAAVCWFVWKLTKLHSKAGELVKKAGAPASKPGQPAYNYEQMMRDLADKRLSIDEILDRCQGQLPNELAEAIDGEKGPASLSPSPESRDASRLKWFETIAKGVPNYKVVPPPPQPPPTVTVKGWVTLCSCRRGMMGGGLTAMITEPMYRGGLKERLRGPGVRCQACRDRGFVIITAG